jgi:hypothetical protein
MERFFNTQHINIHLLILLLLNTIHVFSMDILHCNYQYLLNLATDRVCETHTIEYMYLICLYYFSETFHMITQWILKNNPKYRHWWKRSKIMDLMTQCWSTIHEIKLLMFCWSFAWHRKHLHAQTHPRDCNWLYYTHETFHLCTTCLERVRWTVYRTWIVELKVCLFTDWSTICEFKILE